MHVRHRDVVDVTGRIPEASQLARQCCIEDHPEPCKWLPFGNRHPVWVECVRQPEIPHQPALLVFDQEARNGHDDGGHLVA